MAAVLSCVSAVAQTSDHILVEPKAAEQTAQAPQSAATPARTHITLKKVSKMYEGKDLLVSIVKKLNNRMGADWLTAFRHAPELSDSQISKFTQALEDYLTPEERDFVAINLSGYRRAFDCPFVVKLEDRVACRENGEAREAILLRYKSVAGEAQKSGRSLFDLILKQPRSPQLWHSQGKDVFARRLADAIRGMALTVETRRDRPGFTQRELGFERALTAYRHWTSGVESEVVNRALPKSDLQPKVEHRPEPKKEVKPAAAAVAPKAVPAKPIQELVAVAKKLDVPSAPAAKPVTPSKVVATPKVEAKKAVTVTPAKPVVAAKPAPAVHVVETRPVAAPVAKPVVAKPVTPAAKPVAPKPAAAVAKPVVAKKAPVTHAPARKKVVAKKPASTLLPPKELKTVPPPKTLLTLAPPVTTEPVAVVDNDVEKAKEAHTVETPALHEKQSFLKSVTKPATNLVGNVKQTFFHKRPADPKGVVAPQTWTSGEMTGLPIIHDLQEGKEYARYIIMKLRKMAREDLANRDAIYKEQVATYNERKKAFYATKHPAKQKPPKAPVKPSGSVTWYEAVRDGATADERNAFLAGVDRLTPAEKSFFVPLLASIGEVGHITNGRCKGKECVGDMTGISNGVSVLRTIYNSAKSPLWGSGKDFIDAEHHDKSLPDRMFHAALKNGRFSPWNRSGRFRSGERTQGNIPGMLKTLEQALMTPDDAVSKDLGPQKAERMINAYAQFSTDNVNYDGFDLKVKDTIYPMVFFSAPGYHLSGTAVPSGRYLTYKNDDTKTKYYPSAHRWGYDKNTGYKLVASKNEETQ